MTAATSSPSHAALSALPPQPPQPAAPPSPAALKLGYAGLVPFVLGAALVWLVRPEVHPFVVDALSKYAALILSFLGGLHWALGMGHAQRPGSAARLAWGAGVPVAAWISALMPAYAGLVLQGVMLSVCYAIDRKVFPAHGWAAWLTLRFRLSVVAALACFVAAAGS